MKAINKNDFKTVLKSLIRRFHRFHFAVQNENEIVRYLQHKDLRKAIKNEFKIDFELVPTQKGSISPFHFHL